MFKTLPLEMVLVK